ncbi:MAG TPA: 2-dehydropantoate 2-reductase [Solirubrobacteraceae bacterium]|nr:2-dehydropantoate 2-reductase [Solirubrobacteraceae bacterium]
MKFAVLGPGGVGGLLAGALWRLGSDVTVIARPHTAQLINERGLRLQSVRLGEFVARPAALERAVETPDVLIVATKAVGLEEALERVEGIGEPGLVLPLLNGLDHLAVLRRRFGTRSVLAGAIRVESDRSEPGLIVHSSPFLLIDMAARDPSLAGAMQALGDELERAGFPVRLGYPITDRSEAEVMWSKLVRLNALACTTSAHDKLLGEIRSTPDLRVELVGAIDEGCAVAQAEGASEASPERALEELERAHATLGSSMQRDIAAGREPELDAIPGAVLRAADRHGIPCPTIDSLVAIIRARIGDGGRAPRDGQRG